MAINLRPEDIARLPEHVRSQIEGDQEQTATPTKTTSQPTLSAALQGPPIVRRLVRGRVEQAGRQIKQMQSDLGSRALTPLQLLANKTGNPADQQADIHLRTALTYLELADQEIVSTLAVIDSELSNER